MKKYVFIIGILAIMILSISVGTSSVQACIINQNPPNNCNTLPSQLASQDIVAAAHWSVDSPDPGGWIFAAVSYEPGLCNNAYLYVSGFHPAGIFGPTSPSITFSGTNSSVKINYYKESNVLSVTAQVNFTFMSAGAASAEIHTVNINWTLPSQSTTHFISYNCIRDYTKDSWSDTNAKVSIDLFGSTPHADFSTSDWATVGILNAQQTMAVAHWIVDSPQPGGWVFAAAGKDNGCRDAWLYVAGYHPAGSVGQYAALFEALNTTDVQLTETRNSISISTITMNFTETSIGAVPPITYVPHDVSVSWASTPQPQMQNNFCSNNRITSLNQNNWQPAISNMAINIHGSTEHPVVSASSWAIANIPQQNCQR